MGSLIQLIMQYFFNAPLPLIFAWFRSLVTKLDAANHFTVSHLENPANWKVYSPIGNPQKSYFLMAVPLRPYPKSQSSLMAV